MYGRIDYLFRIPQLGRHLWYLARLVRCDEFLCIFEAGRRGEEGSVARWLATIIE